MKRILSLATLTAAMCLGESVSAAGNGMWNWSVKTKQAGGSEVIATVFTGPYYNQGNYIKWYMSDVLPITNLTQTKLYMRNYYAVEHAPLDWFNGSVKFDAYGGWFDGCAPYNRSSKLCANTHYGQYEGLYSTATSTEWFYLINYFYQGDESYAAQDEMFRYSYSYDETENDYTRVRWVTVPPG